MHRLARPTRARLQGKTEYTNLKLEPLSSVVSPNLFYTSSREIAYYTAAVGVVLNFDEPNNVHQVSSSFPIRRSAFYRWRVLPCVCADDETRGGHITRAAAG